MTCGEEMERVYSYNPGARMEQTRKVKLFWMTSHYGPEFDSYKGSSLQVWLIMLSYTHDTPHTDIHTL